MLKASWHAPVFMAHSPKKQTTMPLRPCILRASAAPVAMGMLEPTTGLAPSIPRLASARCMLPPLPRHTPVVRPMISAKAPSRSMPRARVWPWLRWVVKRRPPPSSREPRHRHNLLADAPCDEPRKSRFGSMWLRIFSSKYGYATCPCKVDELSIRSDAWRALSERPGGRRNRALAAPARGPKPMVRIQCGMGRVREERREGVEMMLGRLCPNTLPRARSADSQALHVFRGSQ